MATKETPATTEPVTESAITGAMMVRNETAIRQSVPDGFDLALAELSAELETAIQALGVQSITSPKAIMERGLFDMSDAFYFDISEKGQIKTIIIYVVHMKDNQDVLTVGQSVNLPRQKFVNAFDKAKITGQRLTLTNLTFRELTEKPKIAGNHAIVIQFTPDTKPFLTSA